MFANAYRSDIFFYFYQENKNNYDIISNEHDLYGRIIDKTLPTKILIHGYLTSPEISPWYIFLREKFFDKGPHNIICVDWSKNSKNPYSIAIANIKLVGQFIGEFLISLDIPLEKIHLFGYSLGSHLGGFVGKCIYKLVKRKIGRITGLDPAGPGFENVFCHHLRLDKTDANFVDIIHTDIGYFGYVAPLGHVDFYPNGGRNQPICSRQFDENCNHSQAPFYYLESVGTNKLKAQKAHFRDGNVFLDSTNEEVLFGDNVPYSTRGVYHINIDINYYPYLRSDFRIK